MPKTLSAAFDPSKNSIGFLRWLMAFAVIFSHAGPLGDFYGGHDLGVQFSTEQSLGGVAVGGFFFLSGFLITKSRQGSSTIFRYFWRRIVRILPAFWAALLLTACIVGPLAWRAERGTFAGYLSVPNESPLTYFANNMFLRFNQHNLAGLGADIPLGQKGGFDFNGSAWTLLFEFKGYVIIGVFGLFGILGYRWLAASAFGVMLVLNTMTWGGFGNPAYLEPLLRDFRNVMVLTPFMFGMMFALFGDKIRIDDRIALACGGMAFFTYFIGSGWLMYGQFGFLYLLMWAAVRLPLTNWEKYGDFSYGIYIYAWPLMQLAAFYGLHEAGWWAYHLTLVIVIHIVAFASYHLLEKRALALKNWTPQWMAKLLAAGRPTVDRVKSKLVDPDYSSSHFARKMRNAAATAAADREAAELTTHVPEERVDSTESILADHGPHTDAESRDTPDGRRAPEPTGSKGGQA